MDTGDGVTHVVPVFDGFVPQNLIRRLDVAGTQLFFMCVLSWKHAILSEFTAPHNSSDQILFVTFLNLQLFPSNSGRHVTQYLNKLLMLRGYAFNSTADFDTVRQIKEKLCYVSADITQERRLAQETTCLMDTFTLPDGKVIKIGRERFEAPECLFNPSLGEHSFLILCTCACLFFVAHSSKVMFFYVFPFSIASLFIRYLTLLSIHFLLTLCAVDCEKSGMADMVFEMIQDADIDTRAEYYKHIVLSGMCFFCFVCLCLLLVT